jgi:hypothetical protein
MAKRASLRKLRSVLRYDAKTGRFYWRISPARHVKAGARAGYVMGHGYRMITYKKLGYLEHVLAYAFVTSRWPSKDIDHKNCAPGRNRFSNLRPASQSQNSANSKRRCNNTSGFKGVSWDRERNRWKACICQNGIQMRIGRFKSKRVAAQAYRAAAKKLYGEFARTA